MWAVVFEADWEPRPGARLSEAEVRTRRAPASQVWRNPRFTRRQVDDPAPGPGDVIVEVAACGVCGSDTHCYEHDADGWVLFSGPARLPVIVGHEFTGRVVAMGADVRGVRLGEFVAAEGMLYCGVCEACRRGRPNQCPNLDMVGFSAPGAYADYVRVPERAVWSIERVAAAFGADEAISRGATVEPIACAYNGLWVSAGGMPPGSHVAVYGCGPIGLGAILLCRAAGAATITAFDPVPERRSLALACGADVAADPVAVDAFEVVHEATDGWGADFQVEAAGAATRTIDAIERSFAPGGTLVYLGRTGERAAVGLDRLVTGAARIVGARGHAGGGCFPALIRLMAHGRLDPSPMLSCRMPMQDAIAALERSTLRTDGKILLTK